MASSSSVPPKSHQDGPAKHLRPELAALVRALSALPEEGRVRVYAAVNEEAQSARATLSWDDWDHARGSVALGGNAVDDCDGLYDGA